MARQLDGDSQEKLKRYMWGAWEVEPFLESYKRVCEPGSVRSKHVPGRKDRIIRFCCPKGHFHPRMSVNEQCDIGTKTISMLRLTGARRM